MIKPGELANPEEYDDYKMVAITPEIKNAVAWLYVLHEESSVGGQLHVYVDGLNLPVPATMEQWQRGLEPFEPTAVELACWEALRVLTEDAQATACAVYWGDYHPADDPWVSRTRLINGIWGETQYWSREVEDAIGRKAFTLLKGSDD